MYFHAVGFRQKIICVQILCKGAHFASVPCLVLFLLDDGQRLFLLCFLLRPRTFQCRIKFNLLVRARDDTPSLNTDCFLTGTKNDTTNKGFHLRGLWGKAAVGDCLRHEWRTPPMFLHCMTCLEILALLEYQGRGTKRL